MARLKHREKARWVAGLVWYEQLVRLFPDNPYGTLVAFMAGLNIKCAVSPLHDRDTYTAEDVRKWVDRHIDPDYYDFISEDLETVRSVAPKVGDPKKPHVHILMKLPGPHTREYYTDLFSGFIGMPVTKWERVDDFDSYLCYLCHLYNKDKAKYPITSVVVLGGLDGSALIEMTDDERETMYLHINEVIESKGYRYFYQLNKYANECGSPRLAALVRGNHGYFCAIFRSKREHSYDKAKRDKAQD